MSHKMAYRLSLDLGSTSLGWAIIRLNNENVPYAVIKAGVRIFSDGRNPKDGSSLAVTRREARAMRRRRDRLLKRKARMCTALIEHGFFPINPDERKQLERLNPYELRARGLNDPLEPGEFARALFHINQRRGFKSNRKTDKKDNDSGALKTAINSLRGVLTTENCRTVGEWLYQRDRKGQTVRARYRESKVLKDGKSRIDKSYDLYIDRSTIEAEFDALWAKQQEFNPALFNEFARNNLKNILLFQRNLKPVIPGRCTLLPNEMRAPLALPSTQRFRLYQEVNNLRILQEGLKEDALNIDQRNLIVDALEKNSKRSFTQIKKLLGLGDITFNIEDEKRQELKGNTTSAILSKSEHFGDMWFSYDEEKQDEIVMQLLVEENLGKLVQWLINTTEMSEARAETIASIGLPPGYGSLSKLALVQILPKLRERVIPFSEAVIAAGFEHHSALSSIGKGEILYELPYYGQALQRQVGFGSGDPQHHDERRYGRIANPTVHIGLNQVRLIINALIKRYGHPSEVIVEVARELKLSKAQSEGENKRQAENQRRNTRLRKDAATILNVTEERVKTADLQKLILWEELSFDPADRRCPYSGVQISLNMLLSDEVEIEHILPFSITLDDSLNNKTVSLRQANRIKRNRTPWEAFGKEHTHGFAYEDILTRAALMPKAKRYRFGEDGYQKWLKDDAGFLARALNDTRYLSKIAREYVQLICPDTRVIPGQMTAMLRAKFGLNHILGLNGEKNRNDHRHHAVDACVIGVTDQGLLQRFAKASASSRENQLNRLVETMPLPWETYRDHVERAVQRIWVSHKPDHSHEGAMHNDTAYRILGNGKVSVHKFEEGKRIRLEEKLNVIPFTDPKQNDRHGVLENGDPKPYKGYKGDSNYCIEIVRNDKGKWESDVISTFDAYQIVRASGIEKLRSDSQSRCGKPLVMRLMINEILRLETDGVTKTMRVATISGNGQIFMAATNEANVDTRNRSKDDPFSYVSKMAGSLQKSKARRVTISPIGEIRDLGFKE